MLRKKIILTAKHLITSSKKLIYVCDARDSDKTQKSDFELWT